MPWGTERNTQKQEIMGYCQQESEKVAGNIVGSASDEIEKNSSSKLANMSHIPNGSYNLLGLLQVQDGS
jgi:hypothetical protein